MKKTIKKYFFAFLLLGIFVTHSAEALTPVREELSILATTNITATSARFNGEIPWRGFVGTTIGPTYYFEYSTNAYFLNAKKTEGAYNPGAKISAPVTRLTPSTKYYVRLVQSTGNTMEPERVYYDYSNVGTFTTLRTTRLEKDIPLERDGEESPIRQDNFFPKTLIEWLLTTVIVLLILLIIRKGFMKK